MKPFFFVTFVTNEKVNSHPNLKHFIYHNELWNTIFMKRGNSEMRRGKVENNFQFHFQIPACCCCCNYLSFRWKRVSEIKCLLFSALPGAVKRRKQISCFLFLLEELLRLKRSGGLWKATLLREVEWMRIIAHSSSLSNLLTFHRKSFCLETERRRDKDYF